MSLARLFLLFLISFGAVSKVRAESVIVRTIDVFDWAVNLFDRDVCRDLGPAETVRINKFRSETSLKSRYELTRESETRYRGRIYVDFDIPGWMLRQNPGLSRKELKRRHLTKAQGCLDLVNPHLNGPAGENLRLELELREGFLVTLSHPISFSEDGVRSNSRRWSETVGCGVIVHEVFHLVGLVDEYRESSMGWVKGEHGIPHFVKEGAELPLYDCRHRGPLDSIMANHGRAMRLSLPAYEVRTCECRRPTGDDATEHAKWRRCVNELQRMQGTEGRCPRGSAQQLKVYGTLEWKTPRNGENPAANCIAGSDSDPSKRVFCREVPPKRDSLLYPAQFRSILYPGCRERNEVYHACSRNAYLTSREHYGMGCETEVPAECETTDWLK